MSTFPTHSLHLNKASRIIDEQSTKQQSVTVHHFIKENEVQPAPVNNLPGHEVKTEVLTERFRILRDACQMRRLPVSENNSKKPIPHGAFSVLHVGHKESPSSPIKHKTKKQRSKRHEYLADGGHVRVSRFEHDDGSPASDSIHNPPVNASQNPPRQIETIAVQIKIHFHLIRPAEMKYREPISSIRRDKNMLLSIVPREMNSRRL